MKNKRPKIDIRKATLAVTYFLLTLILGELIIYIVQQVNADIVENEYSIMLYIMPSFALVVSAVIIVLSDRAYKVDSTLAEGLKKVAEGDYDAEIPYDKLNKHNAVFADFNKMTQELRSVKTLREDFVHEFSHEFKTPIASINGFANLLIDGGVSPDEQQQMLKIIADESARLSVLSESVLLLSKIENQKLIGENKPYRLDLQITDCLITLSRAWEEKNINIVSELDQVVYSGDELLMRQVWINLLTNAIKYTPNGGEISVSLTKEGEAVVVKVKDNGVGIAFQDQQKIFEKYYQASTGKRSGNGLGLAICKRICELCGGDISVQSRLGEGSEFTVRL